RASYAGSTNYTAKAATKSITIAKADTTTAVTCSAGPFTYSGSAQTPCSVLVTGAGGLHLTPAPDYANNTNAGTATASYTYAASDNYKTSSDSQNFTIGQATPTVVITWAGSTYDGTQNVASAVVNGVGGAEISGSSASFEYYSGLTAGAPTTGSTVAPKDAGDWAVRASYAGSTNYTAKAATKSITIAKADTTTAVTCSAGPFTYSGSAQTPCSVLVTGAGGLHLTPAPDYANNTNAGTATASYTYAASDNYKTSSDSQNFTIGQATPTVVITWAGSTYDGTQNVASAVVNGVGGAEISGSSASFEYYSGLTAGAPTTGSTVAPKDAGDWAVRASYAGSTNYTAKAATKSITIAKADTTTAVTCSAGPFTYSGSAQTPCSVLVTGAGGLHLTPAPDYANNTNAGTATASYTYAASDNYKTSSDSQNFTIGQATPTVVITWAGSTYDGTQNVASAVVNGVGGAEISGSSASFEYYSGLTAGAPTTGSTVAPKDAGDWAVRASYAGS